MLNMLDCYTKEELQEFWECTSETVCETYNSIINFLKQKRFKRVKSIYDIGCGYGPHIELMLNQQWNYHGIDKFEEEAFYKPFKYDADIKYGIEYPIPIKSKEPAIAISVFSLGSADELDDETLYKQMFQIKKDFGHYICITSTSSILKIARYWNKSELVKSFYGNLVQMVYFH